MSQYGSLEMRTIVTLLIAICLVSCQKQQGGKETLVVSDSLYAVGQQSLDNYPTMRSILYYQRALDVLQGDDSASLSRKTKIFAEMGSLYAKRQLYAEAINRYEFSLTSAEQANDTLGMMIAHKGLGDAYQRVNDTQQAVLHYNLADQLAVQLKDEPMQISVAFRKAAAYIDTNQMEQATKQLPQPPYHIEEADVDVYHYVMAHVLEWLRQSEQADEHYASLMESKSPYYQQHAINHQLKQAIQRKDYNQIMQLLRQKEAMDLDNEVDAQYEATGTIGAVYQALHAEKEKADLQIKNQQTKFYTIIAILTLVLIIAIIIILLYHMRSEKIRLSNNQSLLEKYNKSLQADLEAERNKSMIPQPSSDVKTMAIREADIYQRLLTSEKPMNEADATTMMALVDSHYPVFKTRLTTFGVVKEHEVRMCYLIKMGFKTSRIATLLSRTDSAISNGRMRLYKKVFGQPGKGEDWDKVILSL